MGRPLTKNEIRLARSIFRDSIKYDKVEVNKSGWLNKNNATAPFGSIHFANNIYKEDFGGFGLRLSLKALFIHEMVHVWQIQNNVLTPLIQGIILRLKPGNEYEYSLNKSDLIDYNMEQQAAIIEDYFLRLNGGSTRNNLEHVLPPASTYSQGVLKKFLQNPGYAFSIPAVPRRPIGRDI